MLTFILLVVNLHMDNFLMVVGEAKEALRELHLIH